MTNSDEILAYYIICDCGDGSASIEFFKTEQEAEDADERELREMGMGTLSEGVRTLTKRNLPWAMINLTTD